MLGPTRGEALASAAAKRQRREEARAKASAAADSPVSSQLRPPTNIGLLRGGAMSPQSAARARADDALKHRADTLDAIDRAIALAVANRRGNTDVVAAAPLPSAMSDATPLPPQSYLGSTNQKEYTPPPPPPPPPVRVHYGRRVATSLSTRLAERAELHSMMAREYEVARRFIFEEGALNLALMLCEEAAEALLEECEAAEAWEAADAVWHDLAAAARRRGDEPPPLPCSPPAKSDADSGGDGVKSAKNAKKQKGGRDVFWERGNSAAELMQGQNFKKEIHKHDIHKKKNSKAGIFTLLPRSVVALMRHNRPPEQVDVDAVAQPLSHPPSSSSPMHLDPERAAAYATAAEAAAAPASTAANDDDDDDDAADSPPPRPELGEGVTDALRTASSIRLQARLLDSVTRLRAQTVSYTLRRGVARWRTGNLDECVDDTRAAAEGMIALGLANPIRDRNRNRNEHEHEHESGDDNGGCSLRPRGWIPDDSRGSDGGGGIREEDDDDDNDDGDRGSDCGSAARTMVGGPESVETINYYLGVSLAALGDVRGGVRALEEAAAAGAWRSRWRGRHRRERKEKAKEMEMEVEEEDWARSGEGVHPATMFELAKLRMRAGDASGAETAAAATLSRNPNNREACLCHAHALHALKRYDEAAEELMRECQLRRLESDNKCGSAARNTSSSPSSPMVLPELLELSTLTWLPSSKNDGDVPSSYPIPLLLPSPPPRGPHVGSQGTRVRRRL